jgi:protein-S-isoprenylcysteine O-methyltransferase Ste14
MNDALRISCSALYLVGPVVASLALLRRRQNLSPMRSRIGGWRWYVPLILLPIEWLLPPLFILLGVGEVEVNWLASRMVGFIVGLAGTALLVWASIRLGRFMMHDAGVRDDHALIDRGPYQFVRHPVYTGYLALLLGSGIASMNIFLWLLWPVSLLGILIQAASEEKLLRQRFGHVYECYAQQTGGLLPRLWRQDREVGAATDGGRSIIEQ